MCDCPYGDWLVNKRIVSLWINKWDSLVIQYPPAHFPFGTPATSSWPPAVAYSAISPRPPLYLLFVLLSPLVLLHLPDVACSGVPHVLLSTSCCYSSVSPYPTFHPLLLFLLSIHILWSTCYCLIFHHSISSCQPAVYFAVFPCPLVYLLTLIQLLPLSPPNSLFMSWYVHIFFCILCAGGAYQCMIITSSHIDKT